MIALINNIFIAFLLATCIYHLSKNVKSQLSKIEKLKDSSRVRKVNPDILIRNYLYFLLDLIIFLDLHIYESIPRTSQSILFLFFSGLLIGL